MQFMTAFNTGAHYTEHGQRIAVWRFSDVFMMRDFDRDIDYGIAVPTFVFCDEAELRDYVMHCYNHGKVQHCVSWDIRDSVRAKRVEDFSFPHYRPREWTPNPVGDLLAMVDEVERCMTLDGVVTKHTVNRLVAAAKEVRS